MDALLIALFLSALTASGGRSPLLMQALRQRFGNGGGIVSGMVVAIAISAAFSAWIGALLAARLTPEARTLLLGLAIGAGGLFLLLRPGPPVRLGNMGGGPFLASVLGFFLICLGESAQLVIAAVSAARANPWMAGIGGWIGCVIAVIAAPYPGKLPPASRKAARAIVAALLLLTGFFTAMSALRLA